jgi:hypothetical protein
LDLPIQDDSSTKDEWSLDSNPQNEDMHDAPEVLLDLELLPDDLNLEDPISLHDDDDSSRSILEQGPEELHAKNHPPPSPGNKCKTISFTTKANLEVIDHLNAMYATKVMLCDGNCV